MANRLRLLRFFAARGAGDGAEDCLQELWLKISAAHSGPVAAPESYLFQMANRLMIDRYRSARQAEKRDLEWSAATSGDGHDISDAPSAERVLVARQYAALVAQEIEKLGERPAAIFRRHRVDGVPQRDVAAEFGVSLSTVESDLRRAYSTLKALKERLNEA
ncbi:sigma-70 family RNA polymerase sigma factor [Altererythrobacter indicus]|uniref:Sigma-70 family RNA polymerase sigma factor n=1 Tax=Altericroceibacterium indicum TaxID=374177 RepID=A0A845ABQ8_9SPHN|nr:RNA polymerase sigma factor [Altericroceibacterium indicum]MXP27124.1 sigma-70 family RNA polymerase sigma factor [Altericroceibacterium indicum]